MFLHPPAEPTFVPFRAERLVLGRDPAAGIPLDGRAVSWQHAEILCSGPEVLIRDLDSTNGVQVGGQLVHEAQLEDGSLVRIGDFLGLVVGEPPAPARPRRGFAEAEEVGMMVGHALGAVLAPVLDLGPARITVEGETGTGKALVARFLHRRVRPDGPFVAIDCSSFGPAAPPAPGTTVMPTGLPAGAAAGLARILEEAARGTVFLSNLTALDGASQTQLAAALPAKRPDKLSLIVSSQEPLATAVETGRLLPALHAALAPNTVRLPPLRQRLLDIPALFRHLLERQAPRKLPTLSTELIERLCLYDWPLNVREMELLAQRLVALHGDEARLRVTHLPPRLMPPDREDTTLPVAPVSGVDLGQLIAAVRDAGGNIGGAALRLGITRERAYRLIDRLGRLGIVRGSA